MTTDDVLSRPVPAWMACVRCGIRPRHEDLFICWACREDPGLRAEMTAFLADWTTSEQRALLVSEYGWHGGWNARPRGRRHV